MELQGCSSNNWYQSRKVQGGSWADSMRDGGCRCEKEAVCGVMPLAASCGAMPHGGGGGVMLPQEGDGAMLLREEMTV
jgi:hypothetical protein